MRYAVASLVAAVALAAGPEWFEDRSARSGLITTLRNSATPQRHQIETMVGGVAVLDYDNDGRPDLFFTNGAAQPSLCLLYTSPSPRDS